jgi:hypothetical protein
MWLLGIVMLLILERITTPTTIPRILIDMDMLLSPILELTS